MKYCKIDNVNFNKIGVASSDKKDAIIYKNNLIKKYNFHNIENIFDEDNDRFDLIIAIGGDGFLLRILHQKYAQNIFIYGINFGTLGFLLNNPSYNEDIFTKINNCNCYKLYLLKANILDKNNDNISLYAVNDVAIMRNTSQIVNLQILINDKVKIKNLRADGILVATSAGSTAYNVSAGGPILPIESNLIVMTAINSFMPRNFKYALLARDVDIKFQLLDSDNRSANITIDYNQINNIKEVNIKRSKTRFTRLLFDSNHSLEDRIIAQQFNSNCQE